MSAPDFISITINSSGDMIDAVEGIMRNAAQQAANLISANGETALIEFAVDSLTERIAPNA